MAAVAIPAASDKLAFPSMALQWAERTSRNTSSTNPIVAMQGAEPLQDGVLLLLFRHLGALGALGEHHPLQDAQGLAPDLQRFISKAPQHLPGLLDLSRWILAFLQPRTGRTEGGTAHQDRGVRQFAAHHQAELSESGQHHCFQLTWQNLARFALRGRDVKSKEVYNISEPCHSTHNSVWNVVLTCLSCGRSYPQ